MRLILLAIARLCRRRSAAATARARRFRFAAVVAQDHLLRELRYGELGLGLDRGQATAVGLLRELVDREEGLARSWLSRAAWLEAL